MMMMIPGTGGGGKSVIRAACRLDSDDAAACDVIQLGISEQALSPRLLDFESASD